MVDVLPVGRFPENHQEEGCAVRANHLKRDQVTGRMDSGFIKWVKLQPGQRCQGVRGEPRFRKPSVCRESSDLVCPATSQRSTESVGSRDRSYKMDCHHRCRPRSFGFTSIARTRCFASDCFRASVTRIGRRQRRGLPTRTINQTSTGGKPHRVPTPDRRNGPDGQLPAEMVPGSRHRAVKVVATRPDRHSMATRCVCPVMSVSHNAGPSSPASGRQRPVRCTSGIFSWTAVP